MHTPKMLVLSGLMAAMALGAAAQAGLQSRLEAITRTYPGHVALYAKNLRTGAVVAIDANRPVPTASVIKVSLMLEAFRQVKAVRLSLAQPLTLTKANQVEGSGILRILTPGERLSLRDTIALMMTLSDNTATNMVIDAVGLKPTNAFLAQIGMKNTYFYKKVFMPAAGPQPADQKQFGLGKTTAREMGEMLERIYRCDLGNRSLCREMINIMRDQQDREMIPRYLDDADASDGLSPIADKVGELDAVRNDVALVYTRSGQVVISMFTYNNPDQSWTPDNKAELFIGRVAQTIVHAWSPEGLATSIPHLLAPAKGIR
ncbi:MAG: serine hydrolase [Acidobacteria bacterium]|nr:MAG: serine hydrolase [Acidobacteriota bacterium]